MQYLSILDIIVTSNLRVTIILHLWQMFIGETAHSFCFLLLHCFRIHQSPALIYPQDKSWLATAELSSTICNREPATDGCWTQVMFTPFIENGLPRPLKAQSVRMPIPPLLKGRHYRHEKRPQNAVSIRHSVREVFA